MRRERKLLVSLGAVVLGVVVLAGLTMRNQYTWKLGNGGRVVLKKESCGCRLSFLQPKEDVDVRIFDPGFQIRNPRLLVNEAKGDFHLVDEVRGPFAFCSPANRTMLAMNENLAIGPPTPTLCYIAGWDKGLRVVERSFFTW